MPRFRCTPIQQADGSYAENCSCGCPNTSDIVVPHSIIREARREGLTQQQTADRIPGKPRQRKDALAGAVKSMLAQGLIERQEIPWMS